MASTVKAAAAIGGTGAILFPDQPADSAGERHEERPRGTRRARCSRAPDVGVGDGGLASRSGVARRLLCWRSAMSRRCIGREPPAPYASLIAAGSRSAS